jgi:hypothetical protein
MPVSADILQKQHYLAVIKRVITWSAASGAGGMVVSAFSAAEIQSPLVREFQRTAEFFLRRARQV